MHCKKTQVMHQKHVRHLTRYFSCQAGGKRLACDGKIVARVLIAGLSDLSRRPAFTMNLKGTSLAWRLIEQQTPWQTAVQNLKAAADRIMITPQRSKESSAWMTPTS